MIDRPQQHERAARGTFGMRLRGLIRKEFLQIFRDPSSIAIAFLMPLILLLLFGYGVSLDSESIPVALVVEQPSADAAGFAASFRQSRYFVPSAFSTTGAAKDRPRAWAVCSSQLPHTPCT